jgi:uncharacterized membrane protein
MNEIAATAVLFSAELRPHRSARVQTTTRVVLVVAAFWAVVGLVMLAAGAWPVLPFLGLEVVLLWLFLQVHHRAGNACEAIALTAQALTVRRTNHWGKQSFVSFPPDWLQVNLERRAGDDNRLELRSHGRSLIIASFLLPHEREQLALSLREALARLTHRG